MAAAPIERPSHPIVTSASRAAVLDVLRASPVPLGVTAVAEAVGLHSNTVRAHLGRLVGDGLAVREIVREDRPGRPSAVYSATAAREDGRNYRLLAEVLARYLVSTSSTPGQAATAAGRQWATDQAGPGRPAARTRPNGAAALGNGTPEGAGPSDTDAVTQVLRMLSDTGFAPELSGDGHSIRLHNCPFRELAHSHPDVVCAAHLGIMQGALDSLGAPVAATRLLPFVEDDLCVATLTTGTA
jgi:predicted ArsR family transcriptional regulator